MGRRHARHHGGRQGAGRRLPDRRLPRDREGRGRHDAGQPRLDLRRQSAGHGGGQCRARCHAGAGLLRQGQRNGQAICGASSKALVAAYPKLFARGARLGPAARASAASSPPATSSPRLRDKGLSDADRRRQRGAHPAAADRHRGRDRRGAWRSSTRWRGEWPQREERRPRGALVGERQASGPPRHFLDIDQYEAGDAARHDRSRASPTRTGGATGRSQARPWR